MFMNVMLNMRVCVCVCVCVYGYGYVCVCVHVFAITWYMSAWKYYPLYEHVLWTAFAKKKKRKKDGGGFSGFLFGCSGLGPSTGKTRVCLSRNMPPIESILPLCCGVYKSSLSFRGLEKTVANVRFNCNFAWIDRKGANRCWYAFLWGKFTCLDFEYEPFEVLWQVLGQVWCVGLDDLGKREVKKKLWEGLHCTRRMGVVVTHVMKRITWACVDGSNDSRWHACMMKASIHNPKNTVLTFETPLILAADSAAGPQLWPLTRTVTCSENRLAQFTTRVLFGESIAHKNFVTVLGELKFTVSLPNCWTHDTTPRNGEWEETHLVFDIRKWRSTADRYSFNQSSQNCHVWLCFVRIPQQNCHFICRTKLDCMPFPRPSVCCSSPRLRSWMQLLLHWELRGSDSC